MTGIPAEVDHFVPWSRYPVDLGHNFVLAHGACNSARGSMLAAAEHLAAWVQRNEKHGEDFANKFDADDIVHTVSASMQVAR